MPASKVKKKKSPIENKIYQSIIGLCEEKENQGVYRGNGHHLAQALCIKVSEGLLPKHQLKLYNATTKTPMSSREIALKCKTTSKIASAQLKNIYDGTNLISFKKKGRIKFWFRYNSDSTITSINLA